MLSIIAVILGVSIAILGAFLFEFFSKKKSNQ